MTEQLASFEERFRQAQNSFAQPTPGLVSLQAPAPPKQTVAPVSDAPITPPAQLAPTDSILENVKNDFFNQVESIKFLGQYISQEGLSGVVKIGKELPGAIADSYIRWYEAAKKGPDEFAALVQDHPLEFIQDMTAPLTLLLSGGGGIVSVLGKSTAAVKAARVLKKAADVANIAEIATDPLVGLPILGVRKATGAIFNKIRSKPDLPDHTMNIGENTAARGAPLASRTDEVKRQVINKLHPINTLARDADNPELSRLAQNMAGGSEGSGLSMYKYGWVDPGTKTPTNNIGVEQALVKLGSARKIEADDALVARRAVELGEQGRAHGQSNAAMLKTLSRVTGRSLDAVPTKEEFKALMAAPEADADIGEFFKDWDAYHRDQIEYGHKSGLYDAETRDAIFARNEFYAPMLRTGFEETGKGGGKGLKRRVQSPIKALRGSERPVLPPTESAIGLTMRMVQEGELNRVMNSLDSVADIEGLGVNRIGTPTGVAARVSVDEVLDTLGASKAERTDISQATGDIIGGEIDFSKPSPIYRPRNARDLPGNVLVRLENGERKFLEVDPEVAQAFGSMRFQPESDLTRTVLAAPRFLSRVARAGFTHEPGFPLLNAARDQLIAFIQSNYGYRPGIDWVKGMFDYLGRGQFYQDMARTSMLQSTLVSIGRPALKKSLMESLQSAERGRWNEIARTLVTPTRWLNGLEEFSNAFEMATRLGGSRRAFNAEIAKGTPRRQALEIANLEGREITTDFALSGANAGMRIYSSLTPFMNARIQGIDRGIRAFKKNPVRTTTKAATLITLPSIALWALNHDDPEYQDMPQIEKDLFWHIKAPTGRWLRIPKPFELGLIFGTLPEHILDTVKQSDPTKAVSVAKRILDEFQPFDIPVAVKPVLEIVANKSFFFDAPLESEGQRRFITEERANDGTTELARILSKWSSVFSLPSIPGKPRGAVLSPIQIEHLVFSETGTLGRTVIRGGEALVGARTLAGRAERAEPRGGALTRTPVVSRFLSNPSGRSQARSDFFELNEALGNVLNTFSAMRGERKREFLSENRKDIRDGRIFRRFSQNVFKLLKRVKQVRNSQTLGAASKRKLLDQLDARINRLAKRALEIRSR